MYCETMHYLLSHTVGVGTETKMNLEDVQLVEVYVQTNERDVLYGVI